MSSKNSTLIDLDSTITEGCSPTATILKENMNLLVSDRDLNSSFDNNPFDKVAKESRILADPMESIFYKAHCQKPTPKSVTAVKVGKLISLNDSLESADFNIDLDKIKSPKCDKDLTIKSRKSDTSNVNCCPNENPELQAKEAVRFSKLVAECCQTSFNISTISGLDLGEDIETNEERESFLGTKMLGIQIEKFNKRMDDNKKENISKELRNKLEEIKKNLIVNDFDKSSSTDVPVVRSPKLEQPTSTINDDHYSSNKATPTRNIDSLVTSTIIKKLKDVVAVDSFSLSNINSKTEKSPTSIIALQSSSTNSATVENIHESFRPNSENLNVPKTASAMTRSSSLLSMSSLQNRRKSVTDKNSVNRRLTGTRSSSVSSRNNKPSEEMPNDPKIEKLLNRIKPVTNNNIQVKKCTSTKPVGPLKVPNSLSNLSSNATKSSTLEGKEHRTTKNSQTHTKAQNSPSNALSNATNISTLETRKHTIGKMLQTPEEGSIPSKEEKNLPGTEMTSKSAGTQIRSSSKGRRTISACEKKSEVATELAHNRRTLLADETISKNIKLSKIPLTPKCRSQISTTNQSGICVEENNNNKTNSSNEMESKENIHKSRLLNGNSNLPRMSMTPLNINKSSIIQQNGVNRRESNSNLPRISMTPINVNKSSTIQQNGVNRRESKGSRNSNLYYNSSSVNKTNRASGNFNK